MNEKKESFQQRLGLPLLFSAIVFAILIISSVIIFLFGILLIRYNAINLVKVTKNEPVFSIILLLFISVFVGTVVSFVFSRFPLKPVRRVIDATNRLAAGDFSTRLDLPGPSAFSELANSFNRMAEELGGIEMLRSDFVDNFSTSSKRQSSPSRGLPRSSSTTISRRNSEASTSTSSSANPRDLRRWRQTY